MEVRKAININWIFHRVCMVAFLLFVSNLKLVAQAPVKSYTVKNGKMFIALSRNISEPSLDSFINQYDLYDLALKDFMAGKKLDSLRKMGWALDINNSQLFIISKPLVSYDE